jgi:hypothetical protein
MEELQPVEAKQKKNILKCSANVKFVFFYLCEFSFAEYK